MSKPFLPCRAALTGADQTSRLTVCKSTRDDLRKTSRFVPRSHDEYERKRRAILHEELAAVAEFDAQLAARVEQRLADRL
jgi:hypothetical protein